MRSSLFRPAASSSTPAPGAAGLRAVALAAWLALGALTACGGGGSSAPVDNGTGTVQGAGSGASAPAGAPASAPASAPTGAPTSTLPVATGAGRTYVVGTGGTLPAGATRVATLAAIDWTTLPAGSLVLVTAGTYPGVTTITSVGTSANPIVVTAYDPASPPILTNSVDFQGAAWVQISHVTVQSPTYAGFIIRNASHHLTVADSTVSKAFAGVNVTSAAGIGHKILRNTIVDSVVDGIDLEVNSDAIERTLVQHNTIQRSGVHGIEVRASHYQVEYNVVSASGQTSGGASGIHVFRGTPTEDSGADNLVRYNTSYANIDTQAYDGNGIEIDQWCNANTVAFNQVWGNDGAGILVYDGSNNNLQNNTARGDGVDSGHKMAMRDEIGVSGTAAANVKGNHVWNNVAVSTRASVSALHVDTIAVSGGNTIGANLLFNSAGGTVLRWTDSTTQQTAAQIDAITGSSGNVVELPAFADTANPLTGGLRLSAQPSLHGILPAGLLDLAGVAPVAADAFFGAYYTAP